MIPNTVEQALIEPSAEDRADTLQAAIEYALDHTDDGLLWLRDWHQGDSECMSELEAHRREQSQMRLPA